MRLIRWALGGLVSAFLLAVLVPASAQAQTAPAVGAFRSDCVRNIRLDGDLLCLLHYNLPQQTTAIPTPVAAAEAWCARLRNQTGCAANPVAPDEPTSIISGDAWVTLCYLTGSQDGCFSAPSPGTLIDQTPAPRINYALGGIYLTAGHGVAWDDTTVNMCIEPGTGFTSPVPACVPVDFNDEASDTESQRDELAVVLVQLMRDITQRRQIAKTTFVTSRGKITPTGAELAVEAYPDMVAVAPDAFAVVTKQAVTETFATAPANASALQQAIYLTATAVAWGDGVRAGGEAALGISGTFSWTLVFLTFGLIAAFFTLAATQDFAMGVAAFGLFLLPGSLVGGPTVSALVVAIICLSFPAAWFVVAKVPH